jgi:recombination protein RecT
MEQSLIKEEKNPIKSLFNRDDVKQKFQELLGKRAASFVTSVLQIAAQNQQLASCDPLSIYQAAAVAATLDLPLNQNLGFAYIVGYNQKQKDGSYKNVAQFQMGYKGFIQLAQRSGQFKSIYAAPIYEGQITSEDPLNGYEFDFKVKSENLIGYAAKFKLLNGYEATLYMTVDQLKKHGTQYSQTFKKGFGLWKDNFDAMAQKTVLKLLLSKFAPLSVEMQKAVITDQAIINNVDTEDITYVDNDAPEPLDKEAERVRLMIEDAKSVEELKAIQPHIQDGQIEMFNQKMEALA